jgi:hypothetical protein
MKHDIIKTEKYLLICDDSEIRVGDWFYSNVLKECTRVLGVWEDKVKYLNSNLETFKVISHLPLNEAPYLDGVPVLPSLPKEDDVKELFKEEYEQARKRGSQDYAEGYYGGIFDGYEQAREKYKFTEEDLRKAIDMATSSKNDYKLNFYKPNEIIQSLQQPKLPIAVECEIEPDYKHIGSTKEVKGSGNRVKNKNAGKPKTIINSEGRVEWIGKYHWK